MNIGCYLFGHKWKRTGETRKAVLEIHLLEFETDEHVCERCGILDGSVGRYDKSHVLRNWWRGFHLADLFFVFTMVLGLLALSVIVYKLLCAV